jgi:hypothetical protein
LTDLRKSVDLSVKEKPSRWDPENEVELTDCATKLHEIQDDLIGSPGKTIWLSARHWKGI